MPPSPNADGEPRLAPEPRQTSDLTVPSTPGQASTGFWIAAVLLAIAATLLFHLAPSLPLGVAFDEPLKVGFVLNGKQNFGHPILMLQIIRFVDFLTGSANQASAVYFGRLAAAASGGLLVFSATALARRAVGDFAALGAGVLTAVAPLTVLHAQLIKEDIFVAPWLILGVLALDHLVATPRWRQAVLFGITAGLAASAKYVGVVLVPLSLLPPLWVATDLRRYYLMVALAVLVGLAVFCAVDLPLFTSPRVFVTGVEGEVNHALSGHLVVLTGWDANYLFTWKANIWPGLRAPLALAGLAGALLVAARWPASPPVLRRLLILAVAWYLMHELSPMKPYPEGARHMTAMAAMFAIFAAYAAEWAPIGFPLASTLPPSRR